MLKQQNFKLTDKQSEALDLFISNATNLMLYGGSRSGKTFFIIWAIYTRAINCPGSRHCILRSKFNAAKRSLWLDTMLKVQALAFPDVPFKMHGTDYYVKVPGDSEIWIGGLDSKERTEKILGNEYSTMYFNECSQLDFSSIQLARTRLAQKNDLVKKTFYDQNPPNKSHWSYWCFEKKLNPLDDVPWDNPEDYQSLLMNPSDNLENIDQNYLSILSSMPEAQKKRFLLGEYGDESEGQVYYEFNREEHVKECNRVVGHTIFIGADFNVNPMTSVCAHYINETFYIFDEFFLKNSDTPKMIFEWEKKKVFGSVIPDSTAKNRKTSGKSDLDLIKAAGFNVLGTRNPFVTDRVNNINRLFKAGKIVISPKCKKLINDLEKVSWRDNQLDQKTDPMLTHISDALGYLCWKIEPISLSSNKAGIVVS